MESVVRHAPAAQPAEARRECEAQIASLELLLAEWQRKRLAAWAPGDEPKGDE